MSEASVTMAFASMAQGGAGSDRAVSVLREAQSLAEIVQADAQATADRLVADAQARAAVIEARVAELKAAIPALENDLALRRSLGLRELTAARDEITRLQAEAGQTIEEATTQAMQITVSAQRRADLVVERTQADVSLVRAVTMSQLQQQVDAQAEAEAAAKARLEEELANRKAVWEDEARAARAGLAREQNKVKAKFLAKCVIDQAEWQEMADAQKALRKQSEADLATLRGRLAEERIRADAERSAVDAAARSRREALMTQAQQAADDVRVQADRILAQAKDVADVTRRQADAQASDHLAESRTMVERARREADIAMTDAQGRAERIMADAQLASDTMREQSVQRLAEAEKQARLLVEQEQVRANISRAAAQAAVNGARDQAATMLGDAQQSIARMRAEWSDQADQMLAESAQHASDARAEVARLLADARVESDTIRKDARDMLVDSRLRTARMALWRDSVARQMKALGHAIDALQDVDALQDYDSDAPESVAQEGK